MDTVKVRELPVKSGPLSLTDLLIVEDNDGTKTTEVRQFRSLLQQSIYFNTVEDMKSATLNEGDVVQTLGFREINDGGGALYKIVYAPTDLDDGMTIHYLHTSDTLRAHLITDGKLNVLQCGAFGDGIADDYTILSKAASKGYPLYFPKRTYKITGPLEFPSGSVIDFNGSTLKCEVSSCLCLGLDTAMENITIKNITFSGKYGIELYPYASNIIIENCTFDSISSSSKMDRGISINGCSDIVIRNCIFGMTGDVATGIQIASGTKNKQSVGNKNILITGNKFLISKYGINMTSTIKDSGVVITNNIMRGTPKLGLGDGELQMTSEGATVGIQMSCNSDSILATSCEFYNLCIATRVSGVVDVNLGLSDLIAEDVLCMYSILSDSATVSISGMQKYSGYTYDDGEDSSRMECIFERMSGKLILNTAIDTGATMQASASLTGYLIDSIDPICRTPIVLTSLNDLNNESGLLDSKVPGYMNVSLSVQVSGNITDLKFPSLNGQLVALYSPNGAILKHNANILCGQDITLNQYTPVILQNKNGIWTRVA